MPSSTLDGLVPMLFCAVLTGAGCYDFTLPDDPTGTSTSVSTGATGPTSSSVAGTSGATGAVPAVGSGGGGVGGDGTGAGGGQGAGPSCNVDLFQDASVNYCGNAFCCEEMAVCAADPISCFDAEGNLVDELLESCMLENACFPLEICSTGIVFVASDQEAVEYVECLGEYCCDPFLRCTSEGADVQACLDCFNGSQASYDLCIEANDCAIASCQEGFIISDAICESGLDASDPEVNLCLTVNCCGEFTFCTDGGANVDGCLECIEGGGGALCDAAIACLDDFCSTGGGGNGGSGGGGPGGGGPGGGGVGGA